MKTTVNRTIEDRLEDIENEVLQMKMMLTQFLSGQRSSSARLSKYNEAVIVGSSFLQK